MVDELKRKFEKEEYYGWRAEAALAKNYINFWAGKKGMFESKKEEAKTVRESLSSDEAFLIKEWTSEDNPFGFA